MRDLLALGTVALLAALSHAQTVPQGKVKRDVTELRAKYDFVVLGGGTAGLTVADRLTEAFPDRTVLVVELGDLVYGPPVIEPPGYPPTPPGWRVTSIPNPALNGRVSGVTIGKAVGGGTVINGQFFDRGSASDYNAWATLGSPEFDDYEDKWDWEGLLPYFKKSVTFTEPAKEQAEKYGYTWDVDAAYGGTTPIQSSFPPFQWPLQDFTWKAWLEVGVKANKECAGGKKVGMCWVPTSQDPYTAKRSHAGTGHFLDVIDHRPNYDVLVLHRVIRVQYAGGAEGKPALNDGPPRVEIKAEGSNTTTWITATREVIISAGALNTPLILQRSGIGPKGVLERAGVKQIVDLPGVGQNFHDHGTLTYNVTLNRTITPNAGTLAANATLQNQAIAEYEERPSRGPYTLGYGNTASYVDLPTLDPDGYRATIAKIEAQLASGSFADHLPAGTDAAVLAGYRAQLALQTRLLADPSIPVWEAPSAALPVAAVMLRPLSRGSVSLDPRDPVGGDPVLDMAACANPVDLDVLAAFVPFFRRYFLGTATMSSSEGGGLGPAVETLPGPNVTRREDLVEFVRNAYNPTLAHPCCTAAMLPRERGGVVAPDLRVFGVAGLSVIDLSVAPMLPGSHTSATVYAMAEKAADIIIRRWS